MMDGETGMNETDQTSPQELMIRQQIIERGIRDERVLAAIRAVPRDRFFSADNRDFAYSDRACPIGHGQTISQPYIVALMTAWLQLASADRVLEVGTGSGYQTAILSKLAGEVYTMERVKPLLDGAWERLMSLNLRNIHFRFGNGTLGWPEAAPFDRILIAAAAREMPRQLFLDQLREGGQAVLPVGDAQSQMLIHVRRNGLALVTTNLCPCRFVDLIE
jgi:protein-L-isoaspartate(D-aspartate) O-methyltransferase